ncbi:hypothetical protein MVEG_10622 [Podila verticillata NRRL 6337]|nr:hypothetical protein MVEG_10622 [Podila verticillata NRRL 6337]
MTPHQPLTKGSRSGSPSPFKESSNEFFTERELIQAEAIALALSNENHQKKQPHEKAQEAHVDDTLLEQIFEIEKLKILLEITDQDIEQFHLQQQKLNANNTPSPKAIAASTSTDIKRLDEKETFVHPGFYTLSSTSSPPPSKTSRKRSLQEGVLEANRARTMTPPQDFPRRHSEGNTSAYSPMMSSPMIPGPLMQSHPPSYSRHWSSYATPPKTPSTPSTSYYPPSSSRNTPLASSSPHQNCDDLPPGQPIVLAFGASSPSLFTRSGTSTPNTTTTPYPPPRSETSSPFPAKKRRSSKFKMDPFQLHSNNNAHYEGPLQQQHQRHQRHPYHSYNKERQHPFPSPLSSSSLSSSPYMYSAKPTYRHNPAQVPASMIPPDHFVFQEALQKQPWLRGLVGGDGTHALAQQGLLMPTSISHTQRGVARCGRSSLTASSFPSFSSSSSSSSSLSSSLPTGKPSTIVIDDPVDPDKDKEKETRRREAAAFAASLTTL